MEKRTLDIFNGQPLAENYKSGSIERHREDLSLRGYTTFNPSISIDLKEFRNEVDMFYAKELEKYTNDKLKIIHELGIVRNPFFESPIARGIFFDKKSLQLVIKPSLFLIIIVLNYGAISYFAANLTC